ncbi:hypothetical protein SOVF_098710 [Spinacia oleracea]|nr:hypothetical protein SOVF_098710 [Spinacia oleracea]
MIAAKRMDVSMKAVKAEAEAVRFAVAYAYDAGYRSVIVESDCLPLVKLLNTQVKERSSTQVVVEDILAKTRNFNLVSFVYARRECNSVAHSIAKLSLSFNEVKVWLEECPPEVLASVIRDKLAIE